MNCKSCKYYESNRQECRQSPPVFNPGFQGGRFPAIGEEDWCGKYKRREDTE